MSGVNRKVMAAPKAKAPARARAFARRKAGASVALEPAEGNRRRAQQGWGSQPGRHAAKHLRGSGFLWCAVLIQKDVQLMITAFALEPDLICKVSDGSRLVTKRQTLPA